MSSFSRNPKDATIQSRESRRWSRWRGSLRGRPRVVTSTGLRSTGGSLSQGLGSLRSWSSLLHQGPAGWLHGCGLFPSRRPGRPVWGRPGDCGLRGCGRLDNRRLGRPLASRPRSRCRRGCGRLRSRPPDHDQRLAGFAGSFALGGEDLVGGSRPEHGVEHAKQLPRYRHDRPLATLALFSTGRTSRTTWGWCRPAARPPPPVPNATVRSLPW